MTNGTAFLLAALAGVVLLASERQTVADAFELDAPEPEPLADDATEADGEASQGPDGIAGAAFGWLSLVDPFTYLPALTDADVQATNLSAFLAMLRKSEGTDGPNGYRVMFGYRYFDSFADHPRKPAQFTDAAGRRLWTSAAGAYQFMAVSPIPGGGSTRVDTWDRLAARLSLPDFSPASQDQAAIALIQERGALADVRAGRFDQAVSKVRAIWASLPGAGYDQPERPIALLRKTYTDAGGLLA